MRIKCFAQEHNTMARPGLETGPLDAESSALTSRPPRLPLYGRKIYSFGWSHFNLLMTGQMITAKRLLRFGATPVFFASSLVMLFGFYLM